MELKVYRVSFIYFWVCLSIKFSEVCSNFNLFLSHEEVKRTLGLPTELFYVREGVVNDYATGWTVKVPPDVHSIYFQWQALSRRPVTYHMALLVNATAIQPPLPPLSPPSVNISMNGTLPRDASTFRLDLPCSGLVSAEVDVVININVTSNRTSQPPVILYLRRRKICLKGLTAENFSPHRQLDDPNEPTQNVSLLFYLLVGAGTFLMVVCCVSVACWKRSSRRKHFENSISVKDQRNLLVTNESDSKAGTMKNSNSLLAPERSITVASSAYTIPSSFSVNSYASLYNIPTDSVNTIDRNPNNYNESAGSAIYEDSYYTIEIPSAKTMTLSKGRRTPISTFGSSRSSELLFDPEMADLKERFSRLQIDRQKVRVSEVIDEGTYGLLYRGCLQREHPELDQKVFVKTLRNPATMESVIALCREGARLANLRHANIVSLVGASFVDRSPPYLVYLGPAGQNFKKYLRKRIAPISLPEMLDLCIQGARAVCFLHANNIVHCDIAARNCIISESLQLRLTDAALSRDFFPEDYISNDCRPIRWLAPEVTFDAAAVSSFSDTWSLGVLLWEIASKGAIPYGEITWWRLVSLLQSGMRLTQPMVCPDEMYSIMESCWNAIPPDRPTASKSLDFLTAFKSNLHSFV